MSATKIAPHRTVKTPAHERPTHLARVIALRSVEPTPQPKRGRRCTNGLLVAAIAALALAYGTRVALSLTTVVGQRGELLLSIQPGPLAAGGAAVGLALALTTRCRQRRPRA